MAYIGRDLQYGVLDKQSFTANSSTTVFTLNSGVENAKSLLVSVGGVIQEPDVAYTASGTTLTFTTAPTTGDVVYVIYLGKELSSAAGRAAITFDTGTGTGATTFTMSDTPANAQAIMVFLNGVTQVPTTDYTVSGTTLTFTSAVASGVGILVYHLGKTASIGTLADGSVTNAKINSMDAAKLTGTLPAGMAADSTSIDQTIASLGLHIAVADNKASFNLPGVFLDQFEDDTGIVTETDCDRVASGEYVTTILETAADAGGSTAYWTDANTGGYDAAHKVHSGPNGNHLGHGNTYNGGFISHPSGSDNSDGSAIIKAQCRITFTGVSVDKGTSETGLNADYYQMALATDTSIGSSRRSVFQDTNNATLVNNCFGIQFAGNGQPIRVMTCHGGNSSLAVRGTITTSWDSSTQVSLVRALVDGVWRGYVQFDGVTVFSVDPAHWSVDGSTNSGDLIGIYCFGRGNANSEFFDCDYSHQLTDVKGIGGTVNATGTLISTASTAESSVSAASGVMLYENATGTATLGTDLKAYFSADNGTSWTEASSYGSGINFNGSSIKMITLGKTEGLTAGTQMKLKAEWANQAQAVAGSQTLIAQNTGTALGNMTDAGGLAKAFDGATTGQNSTSNGARSTVAGEGLIGKDWGNGNEKTVTGVKWWETTDGGLNQTVTMTLQGSTDNFSSSIVDLGNWTWTNNDNATTEKLSGFTTTTAYRYHRIKATHASGDIKCAEVEFYESTAAVAGKETRLHGWAINY